MSRDTKKIIPSPATLYATMGGCSLVILRDTGETEIEIDFTDTETFLCLVRLTKRMARGRRAILQAEVKKMTSVLRKDA